MTSTLNFIQIQKPVQKLLGHTNEETINYHLRLIYLFKKNGHKITELYTEWFSAGPKIISLFRTIPIFETFAK
jgi:hypothetical protein